MATRERGIAPLLRRLGGIRHADFRRDDDTYLRSSPEMVRIINDAIARLDAGQGQAVTPEELRAMFDSAQ